MYARGRQTIRKVPEITAIFWIAKLLTTAMGESTSDFFVFRINPYVAVIIGAIVFTIALAIQFRARKYVAWIYWFAVTMVAVFGTMAADVTHIQLGIPYAFSSLFFALALAIVFTAWRKTEGTLSIHSVNNPRREAFYWATVLATFALGTALGDWTATSLGLGYLTSGILFAGIILIPAVGYRLGLNEVFSFWFAYILTRPLGASFADWLGKPAGVGGKGLGDGHVSLVLTALIILCVIYMTFNEREARSEYALHDRVR